MEELCENKPLSTDEYKAALALCELVKSLMDSYNTPEKQQKAADCAAGNVSGYSSSGLSAKALLDPAFAGPDPPNIIEGYDACSDPDCFGEPEEEE